MTVEPVEPTEFSPEYTAELRRRAVVEYMGTSPQVTFGEMSERKLLQLQDALRTAAHDPTEIWIAGWVDAELAAYYMVNEDGRDAETIKATIDGLLERAQSKFTQTRDHKNVPQQSLLRSQATMAAPAMAVWAAYITDRNIHPPVRHFSIAQAESTRQLLAYYSQNPSVEAAMWADAVTFISIIYSGDEQFALPCPPRLSSPFVDSYHRQTAILFDDESFYDVRVGSAGAPGQIHIPHELLGHDKYAGHELGTLFSTIDMEDFLQATRGKSIQEAKRLLRPKHARAEEHGTAVGAAVLARIASEKARGEQEEAVPDEPREWLDWLQPGRNPYVVDAARTDAVISPLEMQVAEENITVADALTLGWVYGEVAFGRALDPATPTVQIRGDIDRAEEIFTMALEKADEDNVLEFCELSLAHGAIWMQRVVICNEELRAKDIAFYKQVLVHAGNRAQTRHAELASDDPEAIALRELMHSITLCLLIMEEGAGGVVAVVAPPRQRGRSGWDVTVWSLTSEGFNPREHGRLRITEKEDKSSLSDGIVTVTLQHLGEVAKKSKQNHIPFKVFQALAAIQNGAVTNSQAHVTIKKAWKVVLPRLQATEIG